MKAFVHLALRYVILLLLGLGNLWLFYEVFTPLTIYSVLFILKIFYSDVALIFATDTISLNGIHAQIIPACVAGSAYYLLLILNLTTPIEAKKRVKSMLFLFGSFLLVNVLRIVIFASLFLNNYAYFDRAHNAFWYAGSTIFVVLLWFANVKIFRIKNIPIYSDAKRILRRAGQ